MNNDRVGTHNTVVDDKPYSELSGLLAYLNLDSLRNDYEVPWIDDASVDIEINYNSRVKRIHDYGLQGSFGLKQLYALLYKIKDSQDWR